MFAVDIILGKVIVTELRYKYDTSLDIDSEAEYQELLEKLEKAAMELGWRHEKSEASP
jgi:hypothetical protein